jgi:hypothetical protein
LRYFLDCTRTAPRLTGLHASNIWLVLLSTPEVHMSTRMIVIGTGPTAESSAATRALR